MPPFKKSGYKKQVSFIDEDLIVFSHVKLDMGIPL